MGEVVLIGAQISAPLLRAIPAVQETGTRHKPLLLRLYGPSSWRQNKQCLFNAVIDKTNSQADYLAKWATDRRFFGLIPFNVVPAFLLRQNLYFEPPRGMDSAVFYLNESSLLRKKKNGALW